MLSPELQAEILAAYYGQKKKIRRIARELRVCRKTVRTVVLRRTVELEVQSSNRATILDPYKPEIAELLEKEPKISSRVILERIRKSGYSGGLGIVQIWLRKVRAVRVRGREAFLQLQFAPGECAQVDWGEFGDVFGDGVKMHCFVIVLCFSRLLYIEFSRSEKFEEFIRCHENAFKYFCGVPLECWYDNLATAVTDRIGKLVRFNSRFMAYMGHHGIHPQACNPARGNEKGRVEDAVKFIRSGFWQGRSFKDFEDLNKQARVWLDESANVREHRTTRKVVRLHFEGEEKKYLRPMNPSPYDTDDVTSRVVPSHFHIVYETNRYSVPWTLVGMSITLRVSDQWIKVFYNEKFICRHERSYKKHQVITQSVHGQGLLERKPGNRDNWQIAAVKNLGPRMSEYLKLIQSGRRSLKNEVSKILGLVTVYGENEVVLVVEGLLENAIVGVENLELALKNRHLRDASLNPQPLNFQNQRLNRVVQAVDLRRYDARIVESANNSIASEGEKNNGENK